MVTVPLTPLQYVAKKAELQSKLGISLTGYEGTISQQGVTVAYKYDTQACELQCSVTKKPMLVPLALAESKLRSWLTS